MAKETDDVPAINEANITSEEKSPDHSAPMLRATKKVPHYLRASTGSCHDACKHGSTHKFKEKPTHPARRRMSAPLPDGKKTVDIQIYVDKKVQKAVQSSNLEPPAAKVSLLTNSKPRKDILPSRKSPVYDSSKLVTQEARSFTKSLSPDSPNLIKKEIQSSGKSYLSDTLQISKQEVASAAKINASSKQTPLHPKQRNVSEGLLNQNGRVEKPSSLSSALKISKLEVALATKKSVLPNKTVNSQGRNNSVGRGEKPSSSVDSLTRLSGKQTSKTKVGDIRRTSGVVVMRTSAPSAVVLSPRVTSKVEVKKPLRPTSAGKGLKDQNQRSEAFAKNQILAISAEPKEPANEKVVEKTLHMIEIKDCLSTTPDESFLAQSPTSLSPESLNSSSQTNSLSFTSHDVDDQCELDSEDTDSDADGSISNYNGSGDSKADDSLQKRKELTKDNDRREPASLKLKFRRGKVVDLQSETNSLRKLRFRQGRTWGANQDTSGGAQRRSYRKMAAVNSKKEAEAGLVKVVLKHQEMETKKDEQVLFNNVIEETASKLVEKRKSKVKALVGAFETVISLQECKPSAADR